MTLQQLEYIVAVDAHRHFVTAAEACHVTQATLSMMIKKLEEEWQVKIFDRSKQPVVPTDLGQQLIDQAKVILREGAKLKEIVEEQTQGVQGILRIGIIPTLSPYLIPLFLPSFLQKFPQIKLQIHELTTDEIISRLKQNQLDTGLLATPLADSDVVVTPLFYEEFVVYAAREEAVLNKKYVLPQDIDLQKLWLLDEGHCLRNQVINLCELKIQERSVRQLDLTAASIETIKKIVEINEGITVLPALALHDLTEVERRHVRHFMSPAPVREIGLVSFRHFVKEKLLTALREEIVANLPADMQKASPQQIVAVALPRRK
jgi:LysR family transcriptional regulator, hydrogen peroxide-inducible genes activator